MKRFILSSLVIGLVVLAVTALARGPRMSSTSTFPERPMTSLLARWSWLATRFTWELHPEWIQPRVPHLPIFRTRQGLPWTGSKHDWHWPE